MKQVEIWIREERKRKLRIIKTGKIKGERRRKQEENDRGIPEEKGEGDKKREQRESRR